MMRQTLFTLFLSLGMLGCSAEPSEKDLFIAVDLIPKNGAEVTGQPAHIDVELTSAQRIARPVLEVLRSAVIVDRSTGTATELNASDMREDKTWGGSHVQWFVTPQLAAGSYEVRFSFNDWGPEMRPNASCTFDGSTFVTRFTVAP